MQVIVVRCANGVVMWGPQYSAHRTYVWVCGRDGFTIPQPADLKDSERVVQTIAQHSSQLAGAIAQIFELDV